MPNPSPSDLHVDGLLTDVSVAYLQSSTAFGADKLFPRVSVMKQSDKIATYDQGDFLRDESESKRSPGTGAIRIGYNTGSTTYHCDEWALEHAIDDQLRANADAPYSPEADATRWLSQKMAIRREVEFVTGFVSTALWTGSSDAGDIIGGTDFTRWSNAASTPIEDIENASNTMEQKTGMRPNRLAVGRQSWSDLKNHPDIVDRIKHVSKEAVTTDLVARLMGIESIVVLSAVKNTHVEGTSTAVGAYIAGADKALLVHSPSSPGLMTPAAGYTFVWSGLLGSAEGQRVETYRDEATVSDIVRIRGAWTQKVIAPVLGAFFTDTSTNV